jgi:4-hydroxythreonine-4-phosphate dehydrogenase
MNVSPPGNLPLALTMGEPAGISGEITLKAWLRRAEGLPPFFAIDDPNRLLSVATRLDVNVPLVPIDRPEQAGPAFGRGLPVLSLALPEAPVPGRLSPANQPAVRLAIETAAKLCQEHRASGMITNPIHKHALYGSGFDYPGHTEFLAALAGVDRSVMMLASPLLRVVPVTIHLSLAEAIRSLNTSLIIETAVIVAETLARDFGLAQPRLALAGLNPHAGEEGALGLEDGVIVAPAVAELKAMGIRAFGPVASDSLFSERSRAGYDAAICMYHDQALIPIKALDFDGAVNVTLGLPFVRTSPDHGTALDIAGTGKANEASLMAALRLAGEMAKARAKVPA